MVTSMMASACAVIACLIAAVQTFGLSLPSTTLVDQPNALAASTAPVIGVEQLMTTWPHEMIHSFLPLAAGLFSVGMENRAPLYKAASLVSAPVLLDDVVFVGEPPEPDDDDDDDDPQAVSATIAT